MPVERGNSGTAKPPVHGSPTSDLIEAVDWCTYVVGRTPTSVLGMRHKAAGEGLEDDYQMMSLDFSGPGEPGSGATAQISCGRYMQSSWHEAFAYRPPAALQVACEKGIAFIDLPSTLVWFDSFGRHQESLDSERTRRRAIAQPISSSRDQPGPQYRQPRGVLPGIGRCAASAGQPCSRAAQAFVALAIAILRTSRRCRALPGTRGRRGDAAQFAQLIGKGAPRAATARVPLLAPRQDRTKNFRI